MIRNYTVYIIILMQQLVDSIITYNKSFIISKSNRTEMKHGKKTKK